MDPECVSSFEESRAARIILQYLSRYPQAKDTPEGITTWWLQRHRIEHTVQMFSGALELLVARDLIVECRGPDFRPYYRINPRQRGEIARILQDSEL